MRFATIALAAGLGSVALAAQQQRPSTPQPAPQQVEAAMARMRPGPEHEMLQKLAGRWTQEITYNAGAGQKFVAKGTATNRLILGGRFLLSERTAAHPAPAFGEPTLEAVNVYGFDRRTNEYTIVEFDSMGTYGVAAAGRAQQDGAIVMSGETMDDHAGARQMRQYDMVLRVVDPDTYRTAIVFKFAGKPDVTIAEAIYRRIR